MIDKFDTPEGREKVAARLARRQQYKSKVYSIKEHGTTEELHKRLLDLPLGHSKYIETTIYTRVIGGWIVRLGGLAVFVPEQRRQDAE